jgi:transcriptional regulator with XRE-family HTH domain
MWDVRVQASVGCGPNPNNTAANGLINGVTAAQTDLRKIVPMPRVETSRSPSPTDVQVGKRVCMRRKMMSMSQSDLGKALGVTFQQVQKYEKGRNRIGANTLQLIARTLRVPISFFFDDPMKPSGGGATGRQAHSPDYVADFLTTTDGLALAEAFVLIKDARLRRSIVKLVEDLVGEDD